MKSKAIVFTAPLKVSLEEINVPEPRAGQVLVQAHYTGISTGTETRILKGSALAGEKLIPCIPGYSLVGRIVKKGPQTKLKEGDLVYVVDVNYFTEYKPAWGGHVEYALVPETEAVLLPESIDPIAVTFTVLAGVGYHGVERCGDVRGKSVAVVGQGPVGMFAVQFLKMKGAKVIAIDLFENRLAASQKLGADYVVNSSRKKMDEGVKKLFPDGVDVVMEATGVIPVLKEAALLLKPTPRPANQPHPLFVLMATYNGDVVLDYQFLFDWEPNILASRNPTAQEREQVIREYFAQGKLRTKELLGGVFNPNEAPKIYDMLMNNKDTILSGVFQWK
jgi:2-desacetyl-2-hydroxyethyl bacteriochlorophyllide A dehydrogenase